MDMVEIAFRVFDVVSKSVQLWNERSVKPSMEQPKERIIVSYRLPTFNVLANLWLTDVPPADGEPGATGVPVQLYVSSRGLLDITPGQRELWVPPIYLRHSKDIGIGRIYYAEVPSGSGEYYKARWTCRMHLGFANEYVQVVMEMCCSDGGFSFYPGSTDDCGGIVPIAIAGSMETTIQVMAGMVGTGDVSP